MIWNSNEDCEKYDSKYQKKYGKTEAVQEIGMRERRRKNELSSAGNNASVKLFIK